MKMKKRLLLLTVSILIIPMLSEPGFAQENWGPAESITTEGWDDFCVGYGFGQPSISSNDSLLFFSYFCFDSSGIANSIYEDGEWQSPVAIPIGLEVILLPTLCYFDVIDTFLYFSSYDTGGYGGSDIWAIQFENGNWTEPYNLGIPVNTVADEQAPSLTDDLSRLYFERDEIIMYSEIVGGQFTEPVALPAQINSTHYEGNPRISRDGRRLYFSRSLTYWVDSLLVSSLANGIWSNALSISRYLPPSKNESGVTFRTPMTSVLELRSKLKPLSLRSSDLISRKTEFCF